LAQRDSPSVSLSRTFRAYGIERAMHFVRE
jgi:hypothetical protein